MTTTARGSDRWSVAPAGADERERLAMRVELWPAVDVAIHRAEIAGIAGDPLRFAAFIARDGTGCASGFAEASLRNEYVNGTSSSPVAFLEGLYVRPEARRSGAARALVAAVEAWARARGVQELASDVAVDNDGSARAHRSLGFREAERTIAFVKRLR
jgi:aminoglycoside 6'-N-acetyltransferase I